MVLALATSQGDNDNLKFFIQMWKMASLLAGCEKWPKSTHPHFQFSFLWPLHIVWGELFPPGCHNWCKNINRGLATGWGCGSAWWRRGSFSLGSGAWVFLLNGRPFLCINHSQEIKEQECLRAPFYVFSLYILFHGSLLCICVRLRYSWVGGIQGGEWSFFSKLPHVSLVGPKLVVGQGISKVVGKQYT